MTSVRTLRARNTATAWPIRAKPCVTARRQGPALERNPGPAWRSPGIALYRRFGLRSLPSGNLGKF
jgi:hypothetical protein